MSRENTERLTDSLEALVATESFMAPSIRRAMELLLLRNPRADTPEEELHLPELESDNARAAYVLDLLREAITTHADVWREFDIWTDPDDAIKDLEEGKDLRAMVEAYLGLSDDNKELLDDQVDEILQQKIAFADAVVMVWIKDHMDILYRDAQAARIRRVLGGRAVRLTPLTKDAVKEWLDAGTPPDELFCEGHIADVRAEEGYVGVSIGDNADGTGPVTDEIPVWRRDRNTGEMVQEAKIEVIDPSEMRP